MNFSLKHLIRKPQTTSKNPSLMLMLHGYGSNEQDLFSFTEELPGELLVISARAPLNTEFGGYAWYSLYFGATANRFADIPEALEARKQIAQFLDELQNAYHFNPQKSFLMGFSQGAVLSYAVALTFPDKIKNIIAMSGCLDKELLTVPKDTSSYKNLHFFCSHGSVDEIIPVEWARKTNEYLQQNFQLQYHEYPVGHGICPQNFEDMYNWITMRLNNGATF